MEVRGVLLAVPLAGLGGAPGLVSGGGGGVVDLVMCATPHRTNARYSYSGLQRRCDGRAGVLCPRPYLSRHVDCVFLFRCRRERERKQRARRGQEGHSVSMSLYKDVFTAPAKSINTPGQKRDSPRPGQPTKQHNSPQVS